MPVSLEGSWVLVKKIFLVSLGLQRCHCLANWSLQCGFLYVLSNEDKNVLPVNHQQTCLIKRIYAIFDILSSYCYHLILIQRYPKKLKTVKNWIRGRSNGKRASINRLKN